MTREDLGIIGIAVGIVAVGYSIYTNRKMNKICEKIDISVEDISKSANVVIPDTVVNKAVNSAVDREVGYVVRDAANQAVKEIRQDMNNQVRSEVNSIYNDVKKDISERVSKEVANIDMRKLTRDVSERAEQQIIDKFDGNLDDILAKFNRELNSISKIYNSIATTMQGQNSTKDSKETILKIS